MLSKYEYIIGLEIHIKLNSYNKLFCNCENVQEFDNLEMNTHVCPFCTAQPWALPILNLEPLQKAIVLWKALNFDIQKYSKFDRKSYFYPDNPVWYQITQFYEPYCKNWFVEFFTNNFQDYNKITLNEAHIENDAWKTIHQNWEWIIDFNRAGSPLVEVVTNPDFRSDEQVVEFLKELQRIIRINNIWFADLEKWQMRCDVNISVREKWTDILNSRVEIKNMNSWWAIRRAINFEFERQVEIYSNNKSVDQETRWWDDSKKITYLMRSKENTIDYRYFPEPDLPQLEITEELLKEAKDKLQESTFAKIKKYKEEFSFNKEFINWLIGDVKVVNFFENIIKDWFDPKETAKWICGNINRFINENNISISDLKFWEDEFKNFLTIMKDGLLLDNQWKIVLWEMLKTWKSPEYIIDQKWFKPMSDDDLENILNDVLNQNEQARKDLENKQMKVIWFVMWQVIKKTWWKANPKKVQELLKKKYLN